MSTYIILSEKSWNSSLLQELSTKTEGNWVFINKRSEFNIVKFRFH